MTPLRILTLATGTEVGKTYVTATLARGLARHRAVLALKPVESGYADPSTSDAALLARAAGHPLIPPRYGLLDPVSPHLAAQRAQTEITARELQEWLNTQFASHYPTPHVILIESAGGACSPLSHQLTNLDLIELTHPHLVLLIAPDRLGALHDVRAAQLAIAPHLSDPPWLLLSEPAVPDHTTGSNAEELRALGWSARCYGARRGDPLDELIDAVSRHPALPPP